MPKRELTFEKLMQVNSVSRFFGSGGSRVPEDHRVQDQIAYLIRAKLKLSLLCPKLHEVFPAVPNAQRLLSNLFPGN